MKKLAIFAAAFVLTLGLAQCKKEQPNAQITEGETVHITVNVNNNGSRADIQDPSTGHYDFKDGDKLYVGYNNAKVEGELTYSTTTSSFSGNLTIAQSGSQRLHFYYLGGSLTPTVSGSEYTVDISNQTSNYPVISYGTSNKDYDGAGTYRTTLLNKCALVKFTLASGTTDAVAVGGMMTKATIDFANPGVVTPSAAGEITLHTGASNTEKWAILLAQDAVDDALVAVGYYGYTVDIPEIEDNAFAPQFDAINNSEASNLIVLNRLTNDYTATNGQVLTGTLANNVKISIAAGATVTLGGVTINGVNNNNYEWAGLNCEGNATIILKGGTTNIVKGFNQNYPGIHVPVSYTLTINGTGSLTASSNGNGAGIGGGLGISCGNIRIEGGVINATGGYGASGIGGALYGQCGNITISGGTVTANGGEAAAGIGGATSCGTITISDGTIVATGGGRAAGIGSGADGSCGAITISGDTVTAKGGLGASGIGSGLNGRCENIFITGGTVTATGGEDAAGIGSGYNASCGYITITNGVTQVTATKGADIVDFGSDNYYSIGAGAGEGGSCGTVTIGGVVGAIKDSPYTYAPQP